jgi:hypothetical protein
MLSSSAAAAADYDNQSNLPPLSASRQQQQQNAQQSQLMSAQQEPQDGVVSITIRNSDHSSSDDSSLRQTRAISIGPHQHLSSTKGAASPGSPEAPYLVNMLSLPQRIGAAICSFLVIVTVLHAWWWWVSIHPTLASYTYVDILLSLLWTHLTFDHLLSATLLIRAKKINPVLSPPPHLRVAMIVTRAPSEPFHVVQKTLAGMINQVCHSVYILIFWQLHGPTPCTMTY